MGIVRCVAHVIAIVFRGDRGLERLARYKATGRKDCDRLSGRSRIGTTAPVVAGGYAPLRSSFGAIEDWNHDGRSVARSFAHCDRLSGRSRIGTGGLSDKQKQEQLRSSFGAIEDWNPVR